MTIFNTLLMSWFISHFEPLKSVIDFIYSKLPIWLQPTKIYLTCFKCISLWLTYIVTHDFYLAILFSIMAYTYDKIMNSFKTYI